MGKKQPKHKTLFALGNWFMSCGVSLAQRAVKPHILSIDYETVHELINKDTATKYNRRIARELDLRDEDAFKGELCDLFLTCLTRAPSEKNYPRVASDKWKSMLGIKPSTRTPIWAFLCILFTMCCGVLECIRKGTLENTRIAETVKYLFARHVAHIYGHDRRGTPAAIAAAVDAGLIHRGLTYSDDEGNVVTDVKDPNSDEFLDDIYRRVLLQNVFEVITDPRDKATLELYHSCFANGTTIEKEHERKLQKYQELGLRTPSAVRQRWRRIPKRYPELKKLNPYR